LTIAFVFIFNIQLENYPAGNIKSIILRISIKPYKAK